MTRTPQRGSRPASLDAVLAYAWDAGEFTASDAMAATALTRSTTIDAMDTLAELGLLSELPNARAVGDYRKGRPARRFVLAEAAAVLVGVDAGESHLVVAVTDLRSEPLSTVRVDLDPEALDAGARAERIVAVVDEALAEAGARRADVVSLCIGVPAPVNSAGRSPSHRTGFWERTNPGLVDAFGWAPIVRIDNDASLAAVAEGAVGAAVGCRDYIALLAGVRLGAGVVVDGHLLRGAHGGVGEMVAFDHVVGVRSAHGLGMLASLWAAAAVERGEVNRDGQLAQLRPEAIDARVVLKLADGGDPDAQRIVEQVGVVLARVVSVLGSMFDPGRVVVSGAISAGASEVVAAARAALPTDLDLPAPELVLSELGADVVMLGAVAAASDAARVGALDVWERFRAQR